ncbi:flagellar biosynthesis protein FlhF [Aquisphaera insulae]|uniref:flagellar biosynthesis protein FlhF n=1 Tax=Aquisphaera insulae TaxID=2712864 RepID=UPI0013E9DB18|nr:flagellar biosynthesis protein FlhF [Aquisphaera insulae]
MSTAARIYRARTMREALARVRRDLGGDAVILASRSVRRRRMFGLGDRELIEVRASATMPSSAAAIDVETPTAPREPGLRDRSAGLSATAQARLGEELSRLHERVDALSRMGRIDHLIPDLPGPLVGPYARLIEAEVPEALARRIVAAVSESLEPHQFLDPREVDAALREAVALCIPVAPPIRAVRGTRRVVALVGPTGVGKTTTVAKLAADFKLVHGLSVGLVTLDTYRIAAVEQLRTYAEIIDVPLAVANDPAEMERAFDELGAVDIAFIDTAGRSPRDEVKIRELGEFMERARPDEVHLVLSAGAGERTLHAAAERFSRVRADRLILTKLDEAEGLGAALGLLGRSNLPVSYLTTGQAVPDDIEPADRMRLASLVLGMEGIR